MAYRKRRSRETQSGYPLMGLTWVVDAKGLTLALLHPREGCLCEWAAALNPTTTGNTATLAPCSRLPTARCMTGALKAHNSVVFCDAPGQRQDHTVPKVFINQMKKRFHFHH
ncbi:hypothetical protein EYF80_011872 [Liparis tanakae]|uniref:Uncharacterized protein n=1 Tax=Liparis tanakae TaxID=230148 RepID=A0A4Z2IJ57_9TELE|nr:hypothetical protein EYF80_011872 [Liparis tanakae]